MAERVLQKVEDELTCDVCLDTYIEPKLLQCFHVYCKLCLRRCPKDQKDDGQLMLPCPKCRQETPIPPRGVAGLPSAFHINRLLEIVNEPRQENREEAQGAREEERKEEVKWLCPEHAEEELKLYCETCGVLICWKCAYAGAAHHSHDHSYLDKAFERYQREISSSQELVQKQMEKVTTGLRRIIASGAEIDRLYETVQVKFCQDPRQVQIMSQLDRLTREKRSGLTVQQRKLGDTQTKLKSCLDFMKNSMASTDNKYDVLALKTSVIKQINKLTVPFLVDTPVPGSSDVFDVDYFPVIRLFNGMLVPTL